MTHERFATVRSGLGRHLAALLCAALPVAMPASLHAQSLDRFDEREDTGLFTRSNQKRVDVLTIGTVVGLALFEGSETRLGRASWQAIDATLTAGVATEAMKAIFLRPRPSQNPDPNVWFAGSGHNSFPSGEVAMIAAAVTPYIYAYREESPLVYGLIALPVYMGRARMASQAHWMTDVLAGAAVGWGMGYLAVKRETPLVLSVTGHGAWVGWRRRF